MKFSLNTIRTVNGIYGSAGDPAPNGVDALVKVIGAQLGAVEEVIRFGERFEGVVVVKVVSCVDHPDADRLHVCTIDDGGTSPDVKRDEQGYVQVVCGAPNVRAGLTVAWLPPGSTVPESRGKDPFVLEARELRGVVSNGMLASPRELNLGDSHDGILELDTDAKPGTSFVDAYDLKDEAVIDIENKMFTHRPDLFGSLGIARELEGIQGRAYKSPDWYDMAADIPAVETDELPLTVRNEIPELVPRFMAITMRDVQVGPSPVWLQILLAELGLRSINNIVDYTNFFMMETGQPLHAYDYDKVKALDGGDAANIVVRNTKPDEKVLLLNGKTVEPRPEAIIIASEQGFLGLGGVMGGGETEVDETTKNIIIEVASMDMYSVRRTSMHHGLFTDAVTRFSKGQSPLQNRAVLAKIVDEIRTHTGGKVASEVIDVNQLADRKWVHPPVAVTTGFINDRLGSTLTADMMRQLLENVEFEVAVAGDELTITAPFWRTDIELREDVVEEVGRLYGFDRLPIKLPRRSIQPAPKDELIELKQRLRDSLARAGANEVLNYSFVHGDLLRKVGQDPAHAFQLSNALSPDLQYYRLSLTPSLLDKVHPNIKAGYDEFALFEIGKGHNLLHADDDDGLPQEFEMLDVVYAANDKSAKPGAAFYEARKFLVNLAADLGLQLEFRPIDQAEDYPAAKPYEQSRAAQVWIRGSERALGIVGEYRATVRKALKLPQHTAGFSIDIRQLQPATQSHTTGSYATLPRFPKVTQDVTFKVNAGLAYQQLFDFVWSELSKVQPPETLPSLGPIDIYQRPDDLEHKQVTFRFSIASYQKTMTDAEVGRLLDSVAQSALAELGAERL